MDRAPITIHNATVKACVECSHFSNGLCLRSKKIDPINAEASHYLAVTQRTGWKAEDCGPNGQHWTALGIDPRTRMQLAIEQAIMDFGPTGIEADEIFAALTASLKRKYEDHYEADAAHYAKHFSEAVAELEMVPQ